MIKKTDEEWLRELTVEQYQILRKKGTEPPFSGEYLNHKEQCIYQCAGCGNDLFDSSSKFDSGTGWPSFSKIVSDDSVEEIRDISLGMLRTEVVCANCKSHLGHVFEDGPKPSGLRYCINSLSLSHRNKA
tara:strand:- start:4093 stop:4482 length:390 start_codon:yes stop_codon:yes gene_type:complete